MRDDLKIIPEFLRNGPVGQIETAAEVQQLDRPAESARCQVADDLRVVLEALGGQQREVVDVVRRD